MQKSVLYSRSVWFEQKGTTTFFNSRSANVPITILRNKFQDRASPVHMDLTIIILSNSTPSVFSGVRITKSFIYVLRGLFFFFWQSHCLFFDWPLLTNVFVSASSFCVLLIINGIIILMFRWRCRRHNK